MKKTVMKLLAFAVVAALAFTVVHFAVLGNSTPSDTAFTFALEDDKAILTGSEDTLSGAVVLPSEIAGHTVTGIGEGAFKNCADVTAFFFPDTLQSIGAYAFENCTGLVQAILPQGLESIGEGAFWKCSSLVSMTIPTSVLKIGSCAFYKCDSLESLVVPGLSTPVKGIFNVALDIGQTLAIGHPNGAREALDPITTTLYCFDDSEHYSVPYYDALADGFCTLVPMKENDPSLTSYTVRYTDADDQDVAASITVDNQPQGITIAAVAIPVDDPELVYPDPAVQTIELGESNTINFLYAASTYTVTFDTNGGSSKDAFTYSASQNTALGDAERAGYTLAGWRVTESGDADAHYNWGEVGTVYPTDATVNGKYGDVTLTAVWEGNSINVSFDAQGGTADAESKVVTFGETYGTLPAAAREGYTFDGWYSESAGGALIEEATTVATTTDHTVYAHWLLNHYNVTVSADGFGTASADASENVGYGETVTLSAQANPGYAFKAWESDDVTINADNAFVMPDKAVAVHAVFEAVEYTVTFNTNGGSEMAALPYITTDDTALGAPVRNGFTFLGWIVSVPAESGDYNWGRAYTEYDADDTVNGKYGNVTLSATWQANSITVTFDAQGGTASAESKPVSVGSVYGTLPTAEREGYTFGGWYTAADGGIKVDNTTTVTETAAHTLYARWSVNSYAVVVTNDGRGTASADATENVAYGTTVTLSAEANPGYTFKEWESAEVEVSDDNTFVMPDSAVSVKAVFEPVAYTITFDTDGGAEKAALIYTTVDTTTLGTAEKTGYTFLGWTVSKVSDGGIFNWGDLQTNYNAAKSVKGQFGDVTLKALWTPNNIKAIYDPQGGTVAAESKTVTVSSTYGKLATAVREGYTFDGWFTSSEGGTKIEAETAVTQTSDHTIYAHWTINRYTVTVTTDGHGTATANAAENVAYGTTVTLSAEAATGYTFSAWQSSDAAIENDTFTMPDGNVTVNAVFAPIAYTIAFDANGGEGVMDAINAEYDADAVLPQNTFVKTGFEFLGWASTADAATAEFPDSEAVRNLTAKADETVTLYAVWKDIKVELIAREGSTTVIDAETGYIYGLKPQITEDELLNTFLDVLGNGRIEIDGSAAPGTGTVIRLINENTGETAATYTLIIFGDVNGDGMINSSDVTELRMINARMKDGLVEAPYLFAADVYADDSIGSSDVTTLRMVVAKMTVLDQATREVTAA